MPSLTKEDRRRGLEFMRELQSLAAKAPDSVCKSRTYRALSDLRKIYCFSEKEKKILILHWLGQGCSSYEDLAQETGFRIQDIKEVVSDLERDGAVKTTPLSSFTRGRPTLFVQLSHLRPPQK